jgi:hypothetical protein
MKKPDLNGPASFSLDTPNPSPQDGCMIKNGVITVATPKTIDEISVGC